MFLVTILSVSHGILHAQYIISGKVVVEETCKPLAGASIYINGSTIGTSANEAGEFVFPSLGNGFYEIVASYVGYELIVYRASIQFQNLQVTFKLRKKPTELRNIVVLTKDGRAKWLKIFKENFLGITQASLRCSIKNEDEILFADGTSKRAIYAFSALPLEIINKELGYRVFFQLEDFYFNTDEGRTYFYGYSRFEELSTDKSIPVRYLRNRQRYYLGSTMHFFHSLIDNKISEEGFLLLHIRSMKTIDSIGKRNRIKKGMGDSTIKISTAPKMDIGSSITRAEFFKKDTTDQKEVYILNWTDRLRVKYGRDPYGKKFLMQKAFLQGNLPLGVFSDVEMLEPPVYMDPNGSLYNPMAIQMSGYWSFEKMANMLPINFRPTR